MHAVLKKVCYAQGRFQDRSESIVTYFHGFLLTILRTVTILQDLSVEFSGKFLIRMNGHIWPGDVNNKLLFQEVRISHRFYFCLEILKLDE